MADLKEFKKIDATQSSESIYHYKIHKTAEFK